MSDSSLTPQTGNPGFIVYLNVILKRIWLVFAIIVFFSLGALTVSFIMKPVYKTNVLLMIDRETAARVEYNNAQTSWSSDEDYYRTQYKLLESRTLLENVYNQLNLGQYDEFSDSEGKKGIAKLESKIKIIPVMRSRLLNLRVTSADPNLVAKIANTIADTFIAGNINSRVVIAQDVLKILNSSGSEFSQKDKDILNSMPQVVNNELIKKYKAEKADLEMQKAKLTGRYTPNHPDILALQKQIDTIKGIIEDETQKIIQSIRIDLSGRFLGNNIRIVDRAIVPEKPYMPSKKLNLLIGLMLGCFVSFLAAFVLEFFDTTIRNAEELETKLKMPFLGISYIEKLSDNKPEYSAMLKKGNFLSSEAIRNIRAMIGFALANSQDKSFLIASSIQCEGKSYLSCNLAAAMAQDGEKILLIDGDLRRSRLHKIFNVSNEKGLSEILAADASDISDMDKTAGAIVAKTDIDGLSVLSAGITPHNPAELLKTPKLKAFITWAKQNFDRVIIDSPAVLPIADALLWGKVINKAVFVVKTSSTSAKLAKTAINNLKTAGVDILGVVLTMCKSKGFKYDYYYANKDKK